MTHLPQPSELICDLHKQLQQADPNCLLVGIHRGGVWVAQALHDCGHFTHAPGSIDIGLHRDDLSSKGLSTELRNSELSLDIDNRDIILVDDVLHTGRTIRAALNELFSFGRPKRIQLAVLIDRGARELPITADFVGATLDVPAQQKIKLNMEPNGLLFSTQEIAQ